MRPIRLASTVTVNVGGPEFPVPPFLQPYFQSAAATAAQAAAPVSREVARDVMDEARPVIQDTARTAAREVWTSVPKPLIVGGAVAVAALVVIAVRGR